MFGHKLTNLGQPKLMLLTYGLACVLLNTSNKRGDTMYIQEVTNEKGATVYHVEDEGCVQEFWTKEQAQEYVDYVNEIFTHWSETQ